MRYVTIYLSTFRLANYVDGSAVKLSQWQDIHLVAEVFEPTEYLQCHIMCEEIGKSGRSSMLKTLNCN